MIAGVFSLAMPALSVSDPAQPADAAPFSALLAALAPPLRTPTAPAGEGSPDTVDDAGGDADGGTDASADDPADAYPALVATPVPRTMPVMLVGPVVVQVPVAPTPPSTQGQVVVGSSLAGAAPLAAGPIVTGGPAGASVRPSVRVMRDADARVAPWPANGAGGAMSADGADGLDTSGVEVGGSGSTVPDQAGATDKGARGRPDAAVAGAGPQRPVTIAPTLLAAAADTFSYPDAAGLMARADAVGPGAGIVDGPVEARAGGAAPPPVDVAGDAAFAAAPSSPEQVVAVALAYPRPSAPPQIVVDRARRTSVSDPVTALVRADQSAGDTAAPITPDMAQVATLNVAAAPQPVATAQTDPGGALLGAAAPAEPTIQHHLDLAHDGAWLDRLARDIAASADKDGRMRFQLNPERLGSLHVEIAPGANGASVRFTAESEAARALIADAQPQLVAEARAQGMRIADTQVDLSNQNGGRGDASAFAQAQQQQQQQQNQPGGQRVPLFDRPGTAMTRPANGLSADQSAASAERYA